MNRQQRDLKTLIQQATLMQDIDRRAKGNAMITGWLNDLTPEEKAEFQDWLTQTVGPMMDRVSAWFKEVGGDLASGISQGWEWDGEYDGKEWVGYN